jgi:hypothetical protein
LFDPNQPCTMKNLESAVKIVSEEVIESVKDLNEVTRS